MSEFAAETEQGPPSDAPAALRGGAFAPAVKSEGHLNLRDLRKATGRPGEAPLCGLNLSVAAGEFCSLLGASGAGKSTCLSIVAGFETADAGEIRLADARLNDVRPHKRGVAALLGGDALFPHMNVFHNVAFPLRGRGMGRGEIERRVSTALEQAGLQPGETGSLAPARLRPEQRLRAAIARALASEPTLLLLDAPFAALDRKRREHLLVELRGLQRSLKLTTIYATRDRDEALALSDQVALLREGAVEQSGAPSEIYQKPGSVYAARFLGETNWLSGVVEFIRDGFARVRLADGSGLAARAVGDVAVGRPAVIGVRPERVEFTPQGAAAQNSLVAELREVGFFGDRLRLRMRAGGGDGFIVQVRNRGRELGLAPGQRVKIGWRAEDCWAFDGDGDHCGRGF